MIQKYSINELIKANESQEVNIKLLLDPKDQNMSDSKDQCG